MKMRGKRTKKGYLLIHTLIQKVQIVNFWPCTMIEDQYGVKEGADSKREVLVDWWLESKKKKGCK